MYERIILYVHVLSTPEWDFKFALGYGIQIMQSIVKCHKKVLEGSCNLNSQEGGWWCRAFDVDMSDPDKSCILFFLLIMVRALFPSICFP